MKGWPLATIDGVAPVAGTTIWIAADLVTGLVRVMVDGEPVVHRVVWPRQVYRWRGRRYCCRPALDLKCDAVHHSPATGPVRTAPQQGEDAA